MQIVLGGAHTHTHTHTQGARLGDLKWFVFTPLLERRQTTRRTQTAVPDSKKKTKKKARTHTHTSHFHPLSDGHKKDRHTPTQRDKQTGKEGDNLELKRETQTKRETGGGGGEEEKKGKTDKEVCVCCLKPERREGYICATDAVAVEIQTPNTADKNAVWLVICGEKEPPRQIGRGGPLVRLLRPTSEGAFGLRPVAADSLADWPAISELLQRFTIPHRRAVWTSLRSQF